MNIIVVGGGGREHAIIKKLKQNTGVEKIYALPGNGGIAADAECVPIGAKDIDGIVRFARENAIDYAVVAPDDPLVLGLVDELEKHREYLNETGELTERRLNNTRMEVIELPSYTAEEKFHIAKEHLIPKQLKEHGLKASQLKISDDAINELIQYYTKEAGVRSLERCIASLCRKTAKKIAAEEAKRVSIKAKDINDYLGIRKYLSDLSSKNDQVGVVNGLAWTAVGGVLMPIEVLVMKGTGKIEVTGSLGDVMKESSKIAVSYVRNIADKYKISPDFYKEDDLHIHAPEGAVPKDGPSAGVTMTTALVSALSGLKVRSDVAMTGEVTLHGKVLPIGGLREKTMAAFKSGIKTVIIPAANKPDLEEVDKVVKDAIEFVYAENLTDVLDTALIK